MILNYTGISDDKLRRNRLMVWQLCVRGNILLVTASVLLILWWGIHKMSVYEGIDLAVGLSALFAAVLGFIMNRQAVREAWLPMGIEIDILKRSHDELVIPAYEALVRNEEIEAVMHGLSGKMRYVEPPVSLTTAYHGWRLAKTDAEKKLWCKVFHDEVFLLQDAYLKRKRNVYLNYEYHNDIKNFTPYRKVIKIAVFTAISVWLVLFGVLIAVTGNIDGTLDAVQFIFGTVMIFGIVAGTEQVIERMGRKSLKKLYPTYFDTDWTKLYKKQKDETSVLILNQ